MNEYTKLIHAARNARGTLLEEGYLAQANAVNDLITKFHFVTAELDRANKAMNYMVNLVPMGTLCGNCSRIRCSECVPGERLKWDQAEEVQNGDG